MFFNNSCLSLLLFYLWIECEQTKGMYYFIGGLRQNTVIINFSKHSLAITFFPLLLPPCSDLPEFKLIYITGKTVATYKNSIRLLDIKTRLEQCTHKNINRSVMTLLFLLEGCCLYLQITSPRWIYVRFETGGRVGTLYQLQGDRH